MKFRIMKLEERILLDASLTGLLAGCDFGSLLSFGFEMDGDLFEVEKMGEKKFNEMTDDTKTVRKVVEKEPLDKEKEKEIESEERIADLFIEENRKRPYGKNESYRTASIALEESSSFQSSAQDIQTVARHGFVGSLNLSFQRITNFLHSITYKTTRSF